MIKHLRYAPRSNSNYSKIAVFARRYGVQPADRLIEPLFQTGLTKHHSIYLGMDSEGTEWIAENHKLKGVQLVKSDDYFTKGKFFKVKKFDGSNRERSVAVKRALDLLHKSYDLIEFNCEHYAEYVQTGKAISYQLENVRDGLKAFAAVCLFLGFLKIISND